MGSDPLYTHENIKKLRKAYAENVMVLILRLISCNQNGYGIPHFPLNSIESWTGITLL